jgi:hypothetical protein
MTRPLIADIRSAISRPLTTCRIRRSFSGLQRGRFAALRGTAPWTRQTIALPVPPEAHSIHFGFYLHGFGQAFARGFSLEVADEPDLGLGNLPHAPTNLDLKPVEAA